MKGFGRKHGGVWASRERVWSRDDADDFEMDLGGRQRRRRVLAGVSASHAQQTIRVGWTIPAEESKYWMMRRPAAISRSRQDLQYRMDPVPGHRADDAGAGRGRARLRDAGAAVAGQRRGRRQSEGLHRGAARVRKARRLLGLLGGQGRFADQDHRRPQGQDRRHLRDRRRHPGAVQHAAEAERRRSRPRTSSWSRSALRSPRTRCARAASMPST